VSRYAKDDPKAEACIEAVIATLAAHGFSLAHEDSQGAFILEPRTDAKNVHINEQWIRAAFVSND
jgi:hypothetical protein